MSAVFPTSEAQKTSARLRLIDRLSQPSEPVSSLRPHEPTSALPGTPEKAAIIAERIRLGLSPFHEDDAKVEEAGRIAIEPGESEENGSTCQQCIEGKDPLARKAAATTGHRAGDELEIRARFDAAVAERRAAARLERQRREGKAG